MPIFLIVINNFKYNFVFFPVVRGIKAISPERPPSNEDKSSTPKSNQITDHFKALLEFQFNSYLQMEGIEQAMLDNSK